MARPMEKRELFNMVLSKWGVLTSRFVRKFTDMICSKEQLFIYLRDNGTDTTGVSYRKDENIRDLVITLYIVDRNDQIRFQVNLSMIDGIQTHSEVAVVNEQIIEQIDIILELLYLEHENERNRLFRRLSNSLENIVRT